MAQNLFSKFQPKDRALVILFGHILKLLPNSAVEITSKSQKDNGIPFLEPLVRIGMFLVVLLFFVGNEILKIIFRKNMGRNELSEFRIYLSLAAFFWLFLFYSHMTTHLCDFDFSLYSFKEWLITATALLYLGLGIYVWEKGLRELKNSIHQRPKIKVLFPGYNIYFSKQISQGSDKAMVRNLYEPVSLLIVGLIFYLVFPMGGVPLIAITLCYWATLAFEYFWGHEQDRTAAQDTPTEEDLDDVSSQYVVN